MNPLMEYYRRNYICLKDKSESVVYGDYLTEKSRILVYHVLACNEAKRSTCKSRQEIVEFMSRASFNVISMQSMVVED